MLEVMHGYSYYPRVIQEITCGVRMESRPFPERLLPRSFFDVHKIYPFGNVVKMVNEKGVLTLYVELTAYRKKKIAKIEISVDNDVIKFRYGVLNGRVKREKMPEKLEIKTPNCTLVVLTSPFRYMIKHEEKEILVEQGYNGLTWMVPALRRLAPGLGKVKDRNVWVLSYYLHDQEALYGLGENFGPLNKRGTEFFCYATDSPATPNISTYIPIPFLWSTRGYGILLDTPAPSYFDIGYFHYGIMNIIIRDDELSYYILLDSNPKGILRKYYEITGWPSLPPEWSFGFWISRCAYRTQDEVLNIAREFRRRGIPCDVIHIDPPWMGHWKRWKTDVTCLEWDKEAFPDPQSMIDELHELGFKLSLWINPYIEPNTRLYNEAKKKGYLLKNSRGEIAVPDQSMQREIGAGLIDLTNPEAYEFFKEKLKEVLRQGVDVFKSDYGEAAPKDAVYFNGEYGERMHNYYPLLYQKVVFEAVREVKGEGLVWGRSGYTGIQMYPLQWGGDTFTTWQDLYTSIRGVLSLSCSGVVFSSFDTGGFMGKKPSPKLYTRWLQAGVFVSHCRAHGTTPREPWEYGEVAEDICKKFIELRYRLLPYIWSEAKMCIKNGEPFIRPLVMEHPDDPNTWNIDDEYYFGSSILVAPITSPSDERMVYLPKGDWIDFWTRKKLKGGRWIKVACPLDRIPIYVKSGSIIPMFKEAPQYISTGKIHPTELVEFK